MTLDYLYKAIRKVITKIFLKIKIDLEDSEKCVQTQLQQITVC